MLIPGHLSKALKFGMIIPCLCLPAQAAPKKPVLGFYSSWAPPAVRYDKITHLMYAFLLPSSSGSVSGSVPGALVSTAHGAGVKVIASIGGANHSSEFPALAANASARTNFANACRTVVNGGVDGVDIDWEYPANGADSANLTLLLKAIRAAIGPSKLITMDLAPNDEKGRWVSKSSLEIADFLNVMAYDFTGSFPGSVEGQHSSYQHAVIGINYWWRNRGGVKNKVILGVPFYGKNFNAGGAPIEYKDIVSANPGLSPDADQVGRTWFNGPTTIKQKATYVAQNSYGGIMIWQLAGDTSPGAKSLLDAVEQGVAALPVSISALPGNRRAGRRIAVSPIGLYGNISGLLGVRILDLNGRGFSGSSHMDFPASGIYLTGNAAD